MFGIWRMGIQGLEVHKLVLLAMDGEHILRRDELTIIECVDLSIDTRKVVPSVILRFVRLQKAALISKESI